LKIHKENKSKLQQPTLCMDVLPNTIAQRVFIDFASRTVSFSLWLIESITARAPSFAITEYALVAPGQCNSHGEDSCGRLKMALQQRCGTFLIAVCVYK